LVKLKKEVGGPAVGIAFAAFGIVNLIGEKLCAWFGG
jgi:hypothetical protein